MFSLEAQGQERSQARSMVITKYGIVAAESPLAAQAGVDVLARGGTAADAAVAANAVMGVVAPMMNGIGGDLFAIVYEAKTVPGKMYPHRRTQRSFDFAQRTRFAQDDTAKRSFDFAQRTRFAQDDTAKRSFDFAQRTRFAQDDTAKRSFESLFGQRTRLAQDDTAKGGEGKGGRLYGLNGSGWAPRRLTPEFLAAKGVAKMPGRGIDSVTVPGAVEGWSKLLSRFGRKNFSEVLAPAITYAREGFPVTELTAEVWAEEQPLLEKDANAAKTYLPEGRAPRVGEIFRNPDLARSLEEIARSGRDGFYKGETAQRILGLEKKLGGAMAADDLADFSAEWVEPISTTYHGWTVYEIPPNGQGIAALEMLNLMEQFPLAQFGAGSADALHVMIEAKKLAYADLMRYVGDPRFAKVPVEGLLAKAYARERAKEIDMKHANCNVSAGVPPGFAGDTTYLTVVDREGNMVSLIQSNFAGFGSGLVADGTGFVLQNRGALFNLDAKSPDVLAGRKRPLHTIIPAFMTRGEEKIAFGIMGGFNQSQAHAQFVSDIADFGMNIQAALEAPRFSKQTFAGCDVPMERRVAAEVREALAARGHEIQVRGDFSGYMGGGQAVWRDFATGVNYGASDPRKDGEAVPEGPGSGR